MNITRSQFIKKLWGLLLLPYVLLLLVTTEKNRQIKSIKKIRIPQHVPRGTSFYDEVIVVNTNNNIKVFSSRCTHLGCRINKIQQEELVCPCHGSVFTIDGKVSRGPAAENLKELSFQLDIENKELVIEL